MKNIDDMTPRQRTYALRKFNIRIEYMDDGSSDSNTRYIHFSDGDIIQVTNFSSFRDFDSKAECEREAREIGTYKKLGKLTQSSAAT